MAETDEELKSKIAYYEGNGAAKLFYALNRKMAEMAERLNKTNLVTMVLDDPKDKTFDRLKVVWQDASSIASAVKSLGETANITNDESLDTQKPIYKRASTPESMADSLGELAGMKKQ